MKKIFLVSCVSKKRNGVHPARDLYISPLFKGARKYAENHIDRQAGDKWFILSAKYGLLNPETEIPTYNETLNGKTTKERRAWAERVMEQLAPELEQPCGIKFLAGKNYTEHLKCMLAEKGVNADDVLTGRIGERLHFLAVENGAA